MDTSLHHQHILSFELANDESPHMSLNGRDREIRQIAVRDINCILYRISQAIKPGTEDDPHGGLDRNLFPNRLRGIVDLSKGDKCLHFFNPQQVKNNRNGDTPKSSLRTDYIRNRLEAFGVEKNEFLCYPLQLMKVQLKNDLSAFSSSLLGLTGLSLLLFRSSSWTGFQDLPWWGLVLLGILCFALSLFIQMMLSIKMETNREAIIRTCAGLTLFILFGISITVGHYLEAAIMLAAGIAQFLVSPHLMIDRLENIDLIKVITPALGFAGGFCLMLIGPQYEALDHSPFIILMIASFFTTALFGSISLFFPLNKYSNILFRLQAIPWLGWCVLLIPSTSIPT